MGFIFCGVICFGIPIGMLLLLLLKNRKYVMRFLLGAAVFTFFQLILRIPLLQTVFPKMSWFLVMTTVFPVLTGLFYAFTAGLAEEGGRYLAFRFSKNKSCSWMDGIAFGIGHGGIEALWIGVTLFSQIERASQINAAVAGFERLCAMTVHTALTFVILQGFRKGQKRYLPLAIILHTMLNLGAVFIPSVWMTEGYVFIGALVGLIYILKIKKQWQQVT